MYYIYRKEYKNYRGMNKILVVLSLQNNHCRFSSVFPFMVYFLWVYSIHLYEKWDFSMTCSLKKRGDIFHDYKNFNINLVVILLSANLLFRDLFSFFTSRFLYIHRQFDAKYVSKSKTIFESFKTIVIF